MTRIKQFILDVAAPLRRIDEDLLRQYLKPAELELVHRLRKAERLHAIAVAKTIMDRLPGELSPDEAVALIRAALLHDVGKIRYPAGAIEKSLVLLLGKVFRGRLPWKTWKAWDIRQNHPEYGWELVRELESFQAYPYLAEAIRYHHQPQAFAGRYGEQENRLFDLLHEADDLH